jgi:hypothetical protein
VFVKVNKKLLTITKTLTEYIAEFITAVKSFMIQALGHKSLPGTQQSLSLNTEEKVV